MLRRPFVSRTVRWVVYPPNYIYTEGVKTGTDTCYWELKGKKNKNRAILKAKKLGVGAVLWKNVEDTYADGTRCLYTLDTWEIVKRN